MNNAATMSEMVAFCDTTLARMDRVESLITTHISQLNAAVRIVSRHETTIQEISDLYVVLERRVAAIESEVSFNRDGVRAKLCYIQEEFEKLRQVLIDSAWKLDLIPSNLDTPILEQVQAMRTEPGNEPG